MAHLEKRWKHFKALDDDYDLDDGGRGGERVQDSGIQEKLARVFFLKKMRFVGDFTF